MLTHQQLLLQYYISYVHAVIIVASSYHRSKEVISIHTYFILGSCATIYLYINAEFICSKGKLCKTNVSLLNAGKIHAQFCYNVCYTYVHL